jgi:nitroreductase
MELIEGIETRRSVRGFTSSPVSEATLRKLLQAAACSPSYTNTQPWEVSVVTGAQCEQVGKALYALAQAGVVGRPDVIAPAQWPAEPERRAAEHNARRFKALDIARDDSAARNGLRLMNYQFFGAPCVLFLWLDKSLSEWSTFDLGLFTQTLALAAHGLGLGSCLQASLTHYPDVVRDFLDIPDSKRLMLGISIGYPDPDAKLNSYQSSRAGLDEFVRWYS